MNQPATNQLKYPSFILAVDRAAISKIVTPNTLDSKPMWWLCDLGGEHVWEEVKPNSERINAHLVVRQRQLLEKTSTYLQILPYTLIGYRQPDGSVRMTTYYRKKGEGGEERLEGNMSFGWGGHVEIVDLSWKDNGDLDFQHTVMMNLLRELGEEVKFIDSNTGEEVSVHELVGTGTLFPLGFILDERNDVGKHHLGVVNQLILPDHIQVVKREKEHMLGAVMTVDEISKDITSFEPWSEIIVTAHYANQAGLKENIEGWKTAHKEADYHRLAVVANQAEPAQSPATIVQESVIEHGILRGAQALSAEERGNLQSTTMRPAE
jgi:predicted NUDIX family phosphoesterase